MNLWQLPILWLGGWILIIVIHAVMCKSSAALSDEELSLTISAELIKDGNNLFTSGFFYYIGNLLCYFIHSPVLHWILLVAGVLCCLPPLFSTVFLTVKFPSDPLKKYLLISKFLMAVIPLAMAVNIYFVYLAG